MDDVRWFTPNGFGALPVSRLRMAGLRIALEGDEPARLVLAISDSVARRAYAFAAYRRAPMVLNIWDVKTWLLGRGRADPVVDMRGHLFPLPRPFGGYPVRRRYYSRLNYIAHRAVSVWTPSWNSRAAVAGAFRVAAERVPYCFDSDRFNRGVGWQPPAEPCVLSISRLIDFKNHAALLRAAALMTVRPTVRIIGRGPAAGPLRALAAELDVALRLDEAFLTEQQVLAAYLDASVVVCPSRFEGIGLTALEGAAVGVPTVASDIPAHREFAGLQTTLVPLDDDAAMADAIERALQGGPPPDCSARDPFPDLTIEACAARFLTRIEALLRSS